jgi:hypothetical protein
MTEPLTPAACPFSSIPIRNWMAAVLEKDGELPLKTNRTLLVLGSGPFEAVELAAFLADFGLQADAEPGRRPPGESCEDDWDSIAGLEPPLVILGRKMPNSGALFSLIAESNIAPEGNSRLRNLPDGGLRIFHVPHWIERHLDAQGEPFYIRSKSLRDLLFVSQEMFLAALFSGHDPAVDYGCGWAAHCDEHPALKLVPLFRRLSSAFQWPSTAAEPGSNPASPDSWPKVGMLKYLGYAVGEKGASTSSRRSILARLFAMQTLPKVDSEAYVAEWSAPNSGMRLRKMAHSIASFCKSANRRGDSSMDTAVADWEEDLAWLKATYYDGKFDGAFPWPQNN